MRQLGPASSQGVALCLDWLHCRVWLADLRERMCTAAEGSVVCWMLLRFAVVQGLRLPRASLLWCWLICFHMMGSGEFVCPSLYPTWQKQHA